MIRKNHLKYVGVQIHNSKIQKGSNLYSPAKNRTTLLGGFVLEKIRVDFTFVSSRKLFANIILF